MRPDNKPLRVVIDTNVLFSALVLAKNNPPLKVLELAQQGKIQASISPFILEELNRNLLQKAGWDEIRLSSLQKLLFKTAFLTVEPKIQLNVITRKAADNRILECAIDAQADVLITGNMKDIRPLRNFQGIEILTPREFLDTYFPSF